MTTTGARRRADKIQDLDLAGPVTGAEEIEIVQDNTSRRIGTTAVVAGVAGLVFPPVLVHGEIDGAETFQATSPVHTATLTVDSTFYFAAASAYRYELTLILTQDEVGSRLVTWPGEVIWSSGTAPVLSTGPGKVDVLTFISPDEGSSWLGFLAGLDLR